LDHLGSIESITNWGDTTTTLATNAAAQSARYSHDPWGQRRNPVTWSGPPAATDPGGEGRATPRGFTGHEMMDGQGFVHMNGRIYDSLLGRMLSADIVVQDPVNLQSYNRYSYVLNAPLSLSDPTGFTYEMLHWRGTAIWNAQIQPMSPRARAVLGLAGSAVEVVGGGFMLAAPTGLTQVAGGVAIAHGVDGVQANIRQFANDKNTDTFTHQGIDAVAKAAGASDKTANTIASIGDTALGFTDMAAATPGVIRALAKSGDSAATVAGKIAAKSADDVGERVANVAKISEGAPTTPRPSETGNIKPTEAPASQVAKAESIAIKEISKGAQRGIRSLEKRIIEHEQKLADFKSNPTVRPGMEGQPKEVIEAAQEARIRHLEREIEAFRKNIEDLK
jgi:RHS repeat-associated protein